MRISTAIFCIFSLFLYFSSYYHSQAKIIPRFPSSTNNIIKQETEFSTSLAKTKKLPYKTKYFTQILDHFNYNPQSYQKFQQRYLINDTFWGGAKHNAPIFVYTGNEGDIEWFTQNTGFMFEVAPHFKALLVFIEHRFYGKSIPYGGDTKVAYRNSTTLGYLTSTQALADYATLIINLKQNLSSIDSPVVVLGGSYGGMLAAWFRLKYPHVAIGALASSAPILNFENITSIYNFDNTVTQDFRSESENCYKVIKDSWRQLKDTAERPGGRDLLRKSFRSCKEIRTSNEVGNWISEALTYTAMTDYPTPTNFMASLPAYPVKQMCKSIDDPKTGNDTFAKLLGAASVYYNNSGTATCFNLNDHSDPHGLHEWQWQACTEMIMPMASNKDSIFGGSSAWNYTARAHYCKVTYGVEPRPSWIANEYGGQNIHRVLKRYGSNIIFFNGLRDPWSGGGVLNNISDTIIAIVAKHGAHHVDLRFSNKEDPEWLRNVRKQEVNIISKWISQYYHDLALS
ncbi:hypothetical protein ACFE04_019905 [Oxalis oulophora]